MPFPAMLPRWKLQREAERIKRQASSIHWRMMGLLRRWSYDRQRGRITHVTEGALPDQDEMSVMLIYQPAGILGSTLFALEWLSGQGVSIVVVSNAPLSEEDRSRLRPLTRRVIERPNIGYDFGGYREGILSILEAGTELRSLLVFNDSIWFPLRDDCVVLARARQSAADIYGLHTSWLSKRHSGNEYVQSYFFRFSGRVLANPEFRSYWQHLRLMNNKYMVIRSYERKLTRHFARLGFSVDAAIDWRAVVDFLLSVDDEPLLREIFAFQRRTNPNDAETLAPMLDAGLSAFEIRTRVADLIRKRRLFVTMVALHPAVLQALDVPFLKKSRADEFRAQRDVIRSRGLHRDYHPSVRAEIDRWDSPEQRVQRIADPQECRDG